MKNKYYEYLINDLKPMSERDFFNMLNENKQILNSCINHEFIKFINNGYVCKNCGGVVDTNEKQWYECGRRHEKIIKKGQKR